jgi:hypothetical protein
VKAVDRLDFLRFLRCICKVCPNHAIHVEEYGLLDIVVDAVLKELSREIDWAFARTCFETRTRFDCFVGSYRRGIGWDKGRVGRLVVILVG